MKVSCRWLSDYVDIEITPDRIAQLAQRLTLAGLEVEGLFETGKLTGAFVGKVLQCAPVPDSDHLSLCEVDLGDHTSEIVCGAPNVAAGQIVPVVTPGGELPGGFKIEKRKIRGQVSHGMICSKQELGLEEKSPGIWDFEPELGLTPGTDLNELLEYDDYILDIKVPSNRPDCASMYGMAREVAALLDLPLKELDVSVEESLPDVTGLVDIEIEDPKDTPRYAAKLMEGLKIGPSPLRLQHRLIKAGMRPLSNVVDATNFVMLELGQPLHPFDADLLKLPIVIRRAKDGEAFRTLDGEDRTLSSQALMIGDQNGGVCLAGLMGGENSEIRPETNRLLLEIATFFGYTIRMSARSVGLRSEASQRFERDLNPENIPFVAARATHMIQKLTGCQVHAGMADAYPAPPQAKTVTVRPERAAMLLGIDVTPEDCREILSRLKIDAVVENGSLVAQIPSHRQDLDREVDLIEEIGRVYGYDRLVSRSPSPALLVGQKDPVERARDRVRELLAGLGLYEVVTDGFDLKVWRERLEIGADDLVTLKNPMTSGQVALRSSLIPDMLAVVETNLSQGVNGGMIFEWSRAFSKSEGEREVLAGALFGRLDVPLQGKRMVDLATAKGILDRLFERLNLTGVGTSSEGVPTYLHPGQSASFTLDGKTVGIMGALHPSLGEHFALQTPICVFEFSATDLVAEVERPIRYERIASFPVSRRDLSVVAPRSLPEAQIRAVLEAEDMVDSVSLYDAYEGEQIAQTQKSLTYELAFRAQDHTLTDEEVSEAVDRIAAGLGSLDVSIRS